MNTMNTYEYYFNTTVQPRNLNIVATLIFGIFSCITSHYFSGVYKKIYQHNFITFDANAIGDSTQSCFVQSWQNVKQLKSAFTYIHSKILRSTTLLSKLFHNSKNRYLCRNYYLFKFNDSEKRPLYWWPVIKQLYSLVNPSNQLMPKSKNYSTETTLLSMNDHLSNTLSPTRILPLPS